MASNPYRASLRQAKRMDRELERLFARYLGSAEHPRGAVLTAYRVAIAALRDVYRRASPRLEMEVRDVLNTLQVTLRGVAREAVAEAARLGQASATAQVAAYQKAGLPIAAARQVADVEALTAAWVATSVGQVEAVATMAAAGVEQGMVEAALAPAHIQREGSKWIATAAASGFSAWTQGRDIAGIAPEPLTVEGEPFQRQAIAAVDGRTTDCCLAVTGQIVNMDEPFHLTAEPRPWGDDVMAPPFHWNCRTSAVLYREQYDDGVTAELRDLSQGEKGRRADLQVQIRDVKADLVGKRAAPDTRKRKADDKETRRLRRDLKRLRKELSDF